MPYYAVQEIEWEWDSNGAGHNPMVVLASNPEDAARLVIMQWRLAGELGDGAELKVAELNPLGYMEWESGEGERPDTYSPFLNWHVEGESRIEEPQQAMTPTGKRDIRL